jgi:hypothetical protein
VCTSFGENISKKEITAAGFQDKITGNTYNTQYMAIQ